MRKGAGLAVSLVMLLAPAGWAAQQPLLVLAAASLTESMQEIAKAYEQKTGTKVVFSFGASSDLARQIEAGAPADVFFSADTARMDGLEKSGNVRKEDRREFLGNRLVVVVPESSTLKIEKPEDLTTVSRLALADPAAVPAGVYAKKWLESLNLWTAVQPKIVPTLDVRAALAAVESEAAPVGIVYQTDAAISKKVKVAYAVKGGPEITYSVARVAASKNQAAAQAFVDYLAGDAGRAVFARRGFAIKN